MTDGAQIASARMPGLDVARALAVLGMVIVNYRGMMDVGESGSAALLWVGERLEGRAAALFVLLAGVGIALRSRRAREHPAEHLAFERAALLKRAAFLFVAGLLNLHLWFWDILHCYGVFLALAAFLLTAPGWLLWLLAGVCVGGQVVLFGTFDYDAAESLWTPTGAVQDLFFNGLHPVFPWMAFLLVGMWLGRLDLRDAALRRRVLVVAVVAVVVVELPDSLATRAPDLLGLDEETAALLTTWPRPPLPTYVVAATGTAVAVLCAVIGVTQERADARWVVALTATGQLAFTLYIAHAIAILVPQQHGLLVSGSIELCFAYSFAFYAVAIAASLWWRRRYPQGPLETLIRQITGRTTPAPWGGQLARSSGE